MLPEFVAAGEALTDMQRTGADNWTSAVGGSTWNVARVVARLGVATAFAGAISEDLFGEALHGASVAAGLDVRFLQRVARPPLLAFVHQSEPPAYFFVGNDSADLYFDPTQLPAGWQGAARWVHFGGISLAREPLAGRLVGLAQQLKNAGVCISYDPNFRQLMESGYDATLQSMTGLADLVKISDEDLVGLFRDDDVERAFATLRAFNPRATYLRTSGAAGATLYVGAATWSAEPPPVPVVDTVGAGDAAVGGMLYSLMRHPQRSPGDHLRFAVAAGSAACAASGASPPSLDDINRLLGATRAQDQAMKPLIQEGST
jgi:fructokinase